MNSQANEENTSQQGEAHNENKPQEDGKERINSSLPLPQELIQQFPEEIRPLLIQSLLIYGEQYSGPIAHPRIPEGWERILPGSADRILRLSEQQQQHRFGMETRAQRAAILRDRVGIVLGFVLGIGLLALSAYAIALGVALASVAIVASSIASVAGVYVYSFERSKKELQEKRNALHKPSVAPSLPDSQQKKLRNPTE